VASVETVIVHMDESTRRSTPLSEIAAQRLNDRARSPA